MNLEEASMNFDSVNVKPFLEGLKPVIESGFSDPEIALVEQMLEAMEMDEEKELEFPIRYRGNDSILKIGIFMDDIDAPDLYFFTHPKLVAEINERFDIFVDDVG